jgi:hypothetical protein
MAKGMFAQCAVVLFENAVDIQSIAAALQDDFNIVAENPPAESWELGGPSVLVAYDKENNGYVTIDVVHRHWPDAMGDPKADPALFGAWSNGFFGPLTFPNGLKRASQQAWSWPGAAEAVAKHTAFVRLRLTYAIGAAQDAPVIPPGNNVEEELGFLSRLALAVLAAPGALCYFNPNGEVLREADDLADSLEFAAQNDMPALDAWCNVRLFNFNPQWVVMDSVGNGQLDVSDIEAAFPKGDYEPNQVDEFIRNLTLYLLESPEAFEDGHTVQGPGDDVWKIRILETGLADPPRAVIRCLPKDAAEVPPELQ